VSEAIDRSSAQATCAPMAEKAPLADFPECDRDNQPQHTGRSDNYSRIVAGESLPANEGKGEQAAAAQSGTRRIDAGRKPAASSAVSTNLCLLLFFVSLDETYSCWKDRRECEEKPTNTRAIPLRNQSRGRGADPTKQKSPAILPALGLLKVRKPELDHQGLAMHFRQKDTKNHSGISVTEATVALKR
jgi:hypothetical protein